MSLIDWFRPSYRVVAGASCAGCAARQAHIEDLQNLLKSEREGNVVLQSLLFNKTYPQPAVATEPGEMKPLREFKTIAQRRRDAVRSEQQAHPKASDEYWSKVQEEYDKVGKLPTPEKVENA